MPRSRRLTGHRDSARRPTALVGVALACLGCVSKGGADAAAVVVSTTPPLADCQTLGPVDGHATELVAKDAMDRARDELRKEAVALGGNYVVLTAQTERSVDMQLKANDVRLRGRAYHCAALDQANADAASPASSAGATWSVPAAASTDITSGAAARADGRGDGGVATARCPAGSEARASVPPDEPGYECGVRDGSRFVMHGPYARFWPNGAQKIDGTFDHGKRGGTWKTLDAVGQVRDERSYKDGELDGRSRTWDATGALTGERWYRAGAPVDAGRD